MKLSNAEKVRRRQRARIHARVVFQCEYVGDVRERLTCKACGWTKVQVMGDSKIGGALSQEVAKKLIAYRGRNGVSGECPRCTRRARDRQYPKGWGPLGPQRKDGGA